MFQSIKEFFAKKLIKQFIGSFMRTHGAVLVGILVGYGMPEEIVVPFVEELGPMITGLVGLAFIQGLSWFQKWRDSK